VPAQPQHDIKAVQAQTARAYCLAQHAPYIVAVDGARELLLADHIPDPASRTRRGPRKQLQMPRAESAPVAEQFGESKGAGEPVAMVRADRDDCGLSARPALDCQARATLAATGLQHPATAGSLHSAAKAVGALAANHRRLVGAFHGVPLSEKALY
jgi:hypothetical protein